HQRADRGELHHTPCAIRVANQVVTPTPRMHLSTRRLGDRAPGCEGFEVLHLPSQVGGGLGVCRVAVADAALSTLCVEAVGALSGAHETAPNVEPTDKAGHLARSPWHGVRVEHPRAVDAPV